MNDINSTKKIRAAIYIRVSTDEQTKGYGPAVQEEKLRAFCKSQADEYLLTDENIYRDEGYSGSLSIEQRPELKRLFENAANNKFDIVLVYRIDRFFREAEKLLMAIRKLKELNIDFRSATESFATNDPTGKLVLTILGAIAESEKETIRERTMNGKIKAMKTGKWVVGIPPYGYKKDPSTGKLVVVPEEEKVVRKIYNWLVDEKLSLLEIERRMNQLKVPAPYSNKITVRETHNYWYKRTIGRILTNEVYTGTFHYRKFKRPFNNLTSITEKSRLRPREEWVEMKTPAIISQEMFAAAKQQLTHNREFAKRNRKRDYLYTKLIYCSKCGFKMFGGFQPPRKKWEYAGGKYYHGVYRKEDAVGTSKRCEWCPNYSEARLEPIWECLKEILQNPKNMLAPLERYTHKTEDPKSTKERLDEIDSELEALKRKRSRVYDLLVNENITEEQCRIYVKEYDHDEQRLNDEAIRLRQKLLTRQEKTDREQAVRKACEQIQHKLDNVSYEDKTKIVSFFIQRITLHAKEDYAEVVFEFPSYTETKKVKTVSQQGSTFPLVLEIKTVSERERRAQMLRLNPGMYIPKTLV